MKTNQITNLINLLNYVTTDLPEQEAQGHMS